MQHTFYFILLLINMRILVLLFVAFILK